MSKKKGKVVYQFILHELNINGTKSPMTRFREKRILVKDFIASVNRGIAHSE